MESIKVAIHHCAGFSGNFFSPPPTERYIARSAFSAVLFKYMSLKSEV